MQISTGFTSWQRYCMASSSGRQPNFAALNRGVRHVHLCSTGRPSAHIGPHSSWVSVAMRFSAGPHYSVGCRIMLSAEKFAYFVLSGKASTCGAVYSYSVGHCVADSTSVHTCQRTCGRWPRHSTQRCRRSKKNWCSLFLTGRSVLA